MAGPEFLHPHRQSDFLILALTAKEPCFCMVGCEADALFLVFFFNDAGFKRETKRYPS